MQRRYLFVSGFFENGYFLGFSNIIELYSCFIENLCKFMLERYFKSNICIESSFDKLISDTKE